MDPKALQRLLEELHRLEQSVGGLERAFHVKVPRIEGARYPDEDDAEVKREYAALMKRLGVGS